MSLKDKLENPLVKMAIKSAIKDMLKDGIVGVYVSFNEDGKVDLREYKQDPQEQINSLKKALLS